MKIGTMRAEEARAFDDYEGYHAFTDENGEHYGSFEIFWADASQDADDMMALRPGWYWWPCQPGCLPDIYEIPAGPFASSTDAHFDANPNYWEMDQ